ncbi:hypothetical protein [Halomonas huangheensis]|nr:hypothetical protein [Halomonas huangheensis]
MTEPILIARTDNSLRYLDSLRHLNSLLYLNSLHYLKVVQRS